MKKILAFRTDRLGDYIITSNILRELKKKYGHLNVVCSKTNYELKSNWVKAEKFGLNKKNKVEFISPVIEE